MDTDPNAGRPSSAGSDDDSDTLIAGGRLERRKARRGVLKRRRSGPQPRRPASTDRQLILLMMALAVTVFVLGGLVLFLKLRPAPPAHTMAGSFLQSAQQAVKEDPNDPLAHVGLGAAYLREDRVSDATAEFEKALELDDKNWQAALQLGTLLETTDPQRALSLLYIAVKRSPYKETPYLEIGNIQYQQENYRDAKAAYIQSIAIEPAVYESRMGLGRTYEALDRPDLALPQYQQALRLIPSDATAREAVARLTQKQAKPSPAAAP